MRLIDPEILVECAGLSAAVTAPVMAVGFLMWACGWRWQRFWMAAGLTSTAGLLGLVSASGDGASDQTIAIALLLALSAGVLTVELSRLLAFAVGGSVLAVTAQLLMPEVQEPTAMFLIGGMLGVLLYRFWIVLFTGFVGAVLFWYSALGLGSQLLKFDLTTWAAEEQALLNAVVLGSGGLGILTQYYFENRRAGKQAGGAKGGKGDPGKWLDKLKLWKKAA